MPLIFRRGTNKNLYLVVALEIQIVDVATLKNTSYVKLMKQFIILDSVIFSKITIFTGVSGSGKSSIVFDTIAAEAQALLNDNFSLHLISCLATAPTISKA